MVTSEDMNRFAKIIDDCKNLISTVDAIVAYDMSYIMCQLYGKTLLTISEIYILLFNGYPEGAMALARNTYETLVVMTYLIKRKDDQQLIERFIDDYSIKTCEGHLKLLRWIKSDGRGSDAINDMISEREAEHSRLTEKYKDYIVTRGNGVVFFEQYWWAGKGFSFNKLCKEDEFPANYLYDISSYRVHAGMTGATLRFDSSENGILLGACEFGKEMPMFFSMLNFAAQTRLFFDYHKIDCLDIFADMEDFLKVLSRYAHESV